MLRNGLRASSRALVLSLLASSPLFAVDDPLAGFTDVGVTETVVRTRVTRFRPIPLDTARLDQDMARTSELLDEALALYKAIYARGERHTNEDGVELLRYVISHRETEPFEASVRDAARLQEKVNTLQGLIGRISNFFTDKATQDKDLYGGLLDRHGEVVRLVTLYNTLVDWGTAWSLDYDTWNFMIPDERDAWLLDPGGVKFSAFPPLPRLDLRAVNAVVTRSQSGGPGDTPVVTQHESVATQRVVMRQALDPRRIRTELEEAGKYADAAAAARASIRGGVTSEDGNRIYFRDRDAFHAAKAPASDFVIAAAHLKARRNAAYSLLAGSDLLDGDPNLAADWTQITRRLDDLFAWGKRVFMQYDRIHALELNYVLFPRDFPKRNILVVDRPAPDSAPTSTGTGTDTAGKISTQAALNTLGSLGCSAAENQMVDLIPRIHDLNETNMNNILAWFRRSECQNSRITNLTQVIMRHMP